MDHDEAFIQDILEHPEDPSLRLIYADWLDERDDPRGQFLRLEAELARIPSRQKKQRRPLEEQLRQTRKGIDRGWLARLDRTAIENCEVAFDFECPKRWERLTRTEDPSVRYCESCREKVYHCSSVEQALLHGYEGHCVAVDSRTPRKEGDLTVFWRVLGRPTVPRRHPQEIPRGQSLRVTGGEFAGLKAKFVQVHEGRGGAVVTLTDPRSHSDLHVTLRWDQFEVV